VLLVLDRLPSAVICSTVAVGRKGKLMSIHFTCPNHACGRAMRAPDGSAGKKARCPSCKTVVTIPVQSEAEEDGTIRLADLPEEDTPQREAGGYEPSAPGPRMQSCPVCGSEYPLGQACPRCRRSRQVPSGSSGWGMRKYLTILVVLIVFGGLLAAAGYVIKLAGETGHQYTRNLMDSKDYAADAACEMNLSSIYRSLKTAAAANEGKFPASLEDLGYASDQLKCPAKDGQKFLYFPGQTEQSPPKNVLVYEITPAHGGKCNVLRVDGSISTLTVEQVNIALGATRRSLERFRK